MTHALPHIRRDGPVLRVAIGRDDTLDPELLARLHQALDTAEHAPECRLVVLTGRPGTFCTGLDFGATARANAQGTPSPGAGRDYYALLRRMTTMPRVVVSMVDGRAMAGGLGLVAASDLVLATARSQFSLPEALWGLLPCCVLPFLVRRVGFQRAYALTLTTQPMGLEAALRCGLVDEPAADVDAALRRLSLRIAKLEPATIGDVKRYCGGLWALSESTERSALDELDRLMASPVVQRNIEAFVRDRRFPWEA